MLHLELHCYIIANLVSSVGKRFSVFFFFLIFYWWLRERTHAANANPQQLFTRARSLLPVRWKQHNGNVILQSAAADDLPAHRNTVMPPVLFPYGFIWRPFRVAVTPADRFVSGVGPAEHLKNVNVPVVHHSPGVGENLMDHVAVGGLVFLIDFPVSLVMNRVVNIPAALRYCASRSILLKNNWA